MSRRSKIINDDISALRQKLAQLHYEKANMRLWKEKDAADAEVEVRELKWQEENLTAQLDSFRRSLIELKCREQDLVAREQNLVAQVQDLVAQVCSMQRSLSWRVTEPLRHVSSIVRSIRSSVVERSSSSSVAGEKMAAPAARLSAVSTADLGIAQPRNASPDVSCSDGNDTFASSTRSRICLNEDSTSFITKGKEAWDSHAQQRLHDFHDHNGRIAFPAVNCPTVSVVIVSYNNSHFLLLSLLSIANNTDLSYEVIIVDNGSDTETLKLLERVHGATIIRNSSNCGFPTACMQGVACAVGTYLCFLNNDAILGEHSLSTALKVFAHDARVGAVGARILQPDGQLQEAGAIVWCDGTTNGYGFGDDPTQLQYLFRRPVDYCSGAFLVTPRTLFSDIGGFDEGFSPGYYEDADYCMRLWSNDRSVMYEPSCIIHHYGNAGSRHKGEALSIVIRNHEKFYQRWSSELSRHFEPSSDNISAARFAAADVQMRILAIVEEVPPRRDGGKYSPERTTLHELVKRGQVTCAATRTPPEVSDYSNIDQSVELLDATTAPSSVIRRSAPDYDLFWLSGRSNLPEFWSAVRDLDQLVAEVELELTSGVRRLAFDEFLRVVRKGDITSSIE